MPDTKEGSLYLGLDLSTQQLKAIIVSSDLKVQYEANVVFDDDLAKYGIKKGVHINDSESEVFAPVAMWLEAVDLILSRLQEQAVPFSCIRGISGAGQQHGSVFWSHTAADLLGSLDPNVGLVDQIGFPGGLSHPWSPNWQDASTQNDCDEFDRALGSERDLARVTGSRAHHRFTGPQIRRLRKKHPDVYEATARISLVSSFLASLFLGKIAPIDISDVCGMNLWDMENGNWSEALLELVAGSDGVDELKRKLGQVQQDGGGSMGSISEYFARRYGFDPECQIAPFTGDNPATILALPLRPMDAIVSLGTSTTFLMETPKYVPDPAYHFFNHPTTPGLYMFMLCYKNGGLAREKIRDELPKVSGKSPWEVFEKLALETPPLGKCSPAGPAKLGLYFPLPEIVPNVRAGTWRYNCEITNGKPVIQEAKDWKVPEDDSRAIIESQILSLRLRSQNLVISPGNDIPPQPRRVYLAGGGSSSPAIARIVGDILGGVEGVYKLDVGGNACALGGAYKAVWARERKSGEKFEDFIGERWCEDDAVTRIDEGYRPDIWKQYGDILPGLEELERVLLAGEERTK